LSSLRDHNFDRLLQAVLHATSQLDKRVTKNQFYIALIVLFVVLYKIDHNHI